MNEIGLATNPEPPYEPFIRCQKCGNEIYGGEEAYIWENKLICDQCFDDFYEQMTRREKAALLGVEIRRVEFEQNIRLVKW